MEEENINERIEKSPLSTRICACGCENEFQPRRKDQVYLNKQHADHGYNNGKRKNNADTFNKQNKILKKNDNILHDIWSKLNDGRLSVNTTYEVLNILGFDPNYFIGSKSIDNTVYFFSYRYLYCLYNENKKIKIKKR